MGLLSNVQIVVALKSLIDKLAAPIAKYLSLSPENISLVILLGLSFYVGMNLVKLIPGLGDNQGIKLLGGIFVFWLVI